MTDPVNIIDAIITNLDRLTVQGVRNMALIIDSLNALDALRKQLSGEDEKHVPSDPE